MEISVLIVEDESVVALDLEQRLIGMGFRVTGHAHTGATAVELARSSEPDVILMDIKLRGDLDGIETAELIRREVDVPVIFLTAFSDSTNLDRAKRSNAYGYILKPFQERELAIAIELARYKHNTERELHRNRALLNVTLNTIEEGVITIDSNDVILLMNRAACRMTGWDESDAIGRVLTEVFLLHGDGEPDGAYTEDNGVGEPWMTLRDRSGVERLVEVSRKEIKPGASSTSSYALVFRDVTVELENRRRLLAAKEKAEAAARARGDFLARVSHELRTPLNSILGMVQLARQIDSVDGELTEYLDILSGSSESLMALISDLLDYARSDSGGITVRRERFDLTSAVENVGKSHAMDAHRRGLRLINVIDPTVPRVVYGDEQRVIQVLGNLLSNAVKFTNHGYVSLAVRPGVEPRHIRFTVEDTGVGIPADRYEAVFDDFSQLDDPSTRSAGGVGLGLAIVRRLIFAMGGSIDLDSTPGDGSIFAVDIPLTPADESGTKERDEPSRGRAVIGRVRTNDGLVERVWRPLCEARGVAFRRDDLPSLWKRCR
ncbi:MAG: ATP-binding protein, partial [Spirochaetales bacterium]|nr:ATP-binding protein [Spirochaetales bacterium]